MLSRPQLPLALLLWCTVWLAAAGPLRAQVAPQAQGAPGAQQVTGTRAVIPRPESMETGSGLLSLDGGLRVEAASEELRGVAVLLTGYLQDALGEWAPGGAGSVPVLLSTDPGLPAEGYRLDVDASGVTIAGGSAAGVFRGIQTLRQLLPPHADGAAVTVPFVSVRDAPRFAWRGMHMDVSRHFFSLAEIRRFIDLLALYKFNSLHLHLTDDQGWRLQINRYPKLTDEGAWRTLNSQDSSVLRMSRDNPDFHYLPEEHFRGEGSARRYGGFYTQDEMRELIAYAAERHIVIVPEIDMPGHFMAAIASYPELSCTGTAAWGEVFSVPICPGKPEVLEFVENVLDEVAALFPSPYVHIGGDEVEKSTWMEHAGTLELMEREGLTTADEVQSWFIARLGEMLARRGKRMIGWDEIIEGGLPEGATVMHWRGWVPGAAAEAVRAGSDVVRSPTSCCYFDYAETDESLGSVYAFEPVPEGLTGAESGRILGVQANLWSEYIASPAQLEYMAFPRMLALAEVAWTSADRREWDDFRTRVFGHYPRLNALGVHYRVPRSTRLHDRTVVIEDTTIVLEAPVPGIAVRYTTDGSLPAPDSRAHTDPIVVTGDTELRIRAFYPSGRSGPAQTVRIEKQLPREAEVVPGLVEGLEVAYYPIHVTRVDSIRGEPAWRATVPDVRVPGHADHEAFALVYTGYVRVPGDGVYTFATHSDDGSTLHVGDRLVVDNDRPHGPLTVSGQVALRAGLHPILLRFFESGGGHTLDLRWSGPGVGAELQPVPGHVLFRGLEGGAGAR